VITREGFAVIVLVEEDLLGYPRRKGHALRFTLIMPALQALEYRHGHFIDSRKAFRADSTHGANDPGTYRGSVVTANHSANASSVFLPA
jgi:hypothetical protein